MLMFIGRVKTSHIVGTVAIASIPVIFLLMIASKYYDKDLQKPKELPAVLSFGRSPTWIGRIQTFRYGSKDDQSDKLYQINQAKIAIANGGFIGLGPGHSQARNYLPQAYNDFIFAIILEEYGLIGGIVMVFIYLLFLYRCIRLYRKCPYAFGAFLALALSFTLVIQAIANMGVNVNLFPNTGVTLPLVEHGRKQFFVYLFINRYHFKCGKKC